MTKVKNISPPLTYDMHFYMQRAPQAAKDCYNSLVEKGWQFYVVHQTRGYCYFSDKVITVPVWAYNDKKPKYCLWYICHEMSHALVGPHVQAHGPEFQAQLIRICPAEYVGYESEYKKRESARAMIAAGILPEDL